MSNKTRPSQYSDAKGAILEGFDRNTVVSEGSTVPTDGSVGYAPGSLFFKRAGTVGGQLYLNEGSSSSCAFKPFGGSPITPTASKIARGVSTVTGSATVVTGLATVVAVVATMQADASLTNGTAVTATVGDQAGTPAAGSVTIKVWKPTGAGDTTPIASAAAVAVNWIAIGT